MTIEEILADLKRQLAQNDAAVLRLKEEFAARVERSKTLSTAVEVIESAMAKHRQEPDSLAREGLALGDAVRIVLKRRGGPMSLPALVEAIHASEYPYEHDTATLERSLRGVVSRDTKDGSLVRVRRGWYGLPGRDEPEGADEGTDDEENEGNGEMKMGGMEMGNAARSLLAFTGAREKHVAAGSG